LDLMTFRVVAIVAILLTGLAGGLLPLWLGYTPRTQRFFSLGNAFSAGIFLSAGLIHMLPDAEVNLRGVLGEFPAASLIAVIGFFIVLFVERVVSSGDAEAGEAKPGVYAYILALVLSVHSLIAGIALGTEQTTTGVLVIFLAIIFHKGSAAFALGVSLFRGGVPRASIPRTIAIFSSMTPLGIVVGSLLAAGLGGAAGRLVEGVFDALAAGTFIYVAILDVIGEEFSVPGDRLVKFILAALGGAGMAIIGIWS
jgi:solute carrier family 39 (zinc transporter), member 1/2/3